jgi:HSP20 family protein
MVFEGIESRCLGSPHVSDSSPVGRRCAMFSLMPRRRERREPGALARTERSPFDLLRREFASLFDRVFPAWPVPFETPWEMMEPWGIEMEELEKEVVVRTEVPGFEMNEFEVTLRDNVLTIRAEHKEATEEGAAERRHERVERSVTLPAGIEPERIEARLHNGVLEVHVPRVAAALPRRIEVKA